MRSIMQTLARGYGDRAGRSRLSSDITLCEAKPPQGNLIVTAEFPPDIGESGSARLFCVDMKPEDLNLTRLTGFQEDAASGVFRRCMYGYVFWLQSAWLDTETNESGFLKLLDTWSTNLRQLWRTRLKDHGIPFHDRLPDTLASLNIGFSCMLTAMKYYGTITEEKKEMLDREFETVLLSLTDRQSRSVEEDRPTHIFIRKLTALFESNRNAVMPLSTQSGLPDGYIGYEDHEKYYLFLDLAHKAVRRLCSDQNESFFISSKALAKALVEEGIAEGEPNGINHTQRMRIGGKQKRVLVLLKSKIDEITDTV